MFALILIFSLLFAPLQPQVATLTVNVEDCNETWINEAFVRLTFVNPNFTVEGATDAEGNFVYSGPVGEIVQAEVNGLQLPAQTVEDGEVIYFELCFVHMGYIVK